MENTMKREMSPEKECSPNVLFNLGCRMFAEFSLHLGAEWVKQKKMKYFYDKYCKSYNYHNLHILKCQS